MSLAPPPKVRKLQDALHAKAKGSPDYRFYALYDKVYRADVLLYADQRSRENKGSVGVDGQTFADIEAYGVERWLGELSQELRAKLTGWANYYCLGTVSRTYGLVDGHARNRLRQWLRTKMAWTADQAHRVPNVVMHQTYGLTPGVWPFPSLLRAECGLIGGPVAF